MKTIGELQHEYLQNLLSAQKVLIAVALLRNEVNPVIMNVKQGAYRLSMLNQYYATVVINKKV